MSGISAASFSEFDLEDWLHAQSQASKLIFGENRIGIGY